MHRAPRAARAEKLAPPIFVDADTGIQLGLFPFVAEPFVRGRAFSLVPDEPEPQGLPSLPDDLVGMYYTG